MRIRAKLSRPARDFSEELRLSGCGSLSRTPARRSLGRRQQQVGWHAKSGTQSLDHSDAQPLLASQDFAHSARGAEDRHHVGSREAVLVHQMADQIRDARWPAWPFALLIGGDQ